MGSQELAATEAPSFPATTNDETKFFLIGYPLAIETQDAQKISVNDYPWLRSIIENGETMVSIDDAKQFDSIKGEKGWFAISMDDGTTKYYDIDLYSANLIPNTPYVKAYWTAESGNKLFTKVSEAEHPWLKNVIADRNAWVAIENPQDQDALNQFFKDARMKYIEVDDANGEPVLYNLRYIDANQGSVS